ncbi:MAG TPA: heavy-metal-associated domain-containing protein [Chloroflexota bacterium]|nr:heavy-metal-associated domain-containing protein [Chloroflexota bacterium]
MAEITMSVPDISCDNCARHIREALAPRAGVRQVDVDVAGKRVRLEYDEGQADLAAIRAALDEEGYPVAAG